MAAADDPPDPLAMAAAAPVTAELLHRANRAAIDGNAEARAAGQEIRIERVFLAIVNELSPEIDQPTLLAVVMRLQALAAIAGARGLDHWAMEVTGQPYTLVAGPVLAAAAGARLMFVDGQPRFDAEELRNLALAAAGSRGSA